MSPMRLSLASALLASLALSPTLPARPDQPRDIEQALKASYEGKVLTLRNFYGGKKLRFNSAGKTRQRRQSRALDFEREG